MSWRAQVEKLLPTAHADDDDAAEAAVLSMIEAALTAAALERPKKKRRGGSIPGKAANIDRGREAADQRLYEDYFSPSPTYPEKLFRRRFRMSSRLFDRIVTAVTENDVYFTQRRDAIGVIGFSPRQKVTAALRMLCYGLCADAMDEYLRISETTAPEAFVHFVKSVLTCFGGEYLREPTAADIAHHAAINAKRGFPGMFGSLDCTHWEWKNCPVAWRGMYQDRDGSASMILEAVATQNLWIWHSFVGVPGLTTTLMLLIGLHFSLIGCEEVHLN
ncbi:hypothetical protein PR002_g24301 [Phytophthora rubi]|uniref:DDE Tnp4 domain-containing protein n=1 Tax=Phytophthora rubi TaxID=129364 RepID=A0A6A3ICX9_9STRA|nr:hypothetical protein PR002_g24301 [Phytophthora rubi]